MGETVRSPLLGCLHGSARVQAGWGGDGASGVTQTSPRATAFPRGTGDTRGHWRRKIPGSLCPRGTGETDDTLCGDVENAAGRKSLELAGATASRRYTDGGLTLDSRFGVPSRGQETPGGPDAGRRQSL